MLRERVPLGNQPWNFNKLKESRRKRRKSRIFRHPRRPILEETLQLFSGEAQYTHKTIKAAVASLSSLASGNKETLPKFGQFLMSLRRSLRIPGLLLCSPVPVKGGIAELRVKYRRDRETCTIKIRWLLGNELDGCKLSEGHLSPRGGIIKCTMQLPNVSSEKKMRFL